MVFQCFALSLTLLFSLPNLSNAGIFNYKNLSSKPVIEAIHLSLKEQATLIEKVSQTPKGELLLSGEKESKKTLKSFFKLSDRELGRLFFLKRLTFETSHLYIEILDDLTTENNRPLRVLLEKTSAYMRKIALFSDVTLPDAFAFQYIQMLKKMENELLQIDINSLELDEKKSTRIIQRLGTLLVRGFDQLKLLNENYKSLYIEDSIPVFLQNVSSNLTKIKPINSGRDFWLGAQDVFLQALRTTFYLQKEYSVRIQDQTQRIKYLAEAQEKTQIWFKKFDIQNVYWMPEALGYIISIDQACNKMLKEINSKEIEVFKTEFSIDEFHSKK